jgi:hypothetical protein
MNMNNSELLKAKADEIEDQLKTGVNAIVLTKPRPKETKNSNSRDLADIEESATDTRQSYTRGSDEESDDSSTEGSSETSDKRVILLVVNGAIVVCISFVFRIAGYVDLELGFLIVGAAVILIAIFVPIPLPT